MILALLLYYAARARRGFAGGGGEEKLMTAPPSFATLWMLFNPWTEEKKNGVKEVG